MKFRHREIRLESLAGRLLDIKPIPATRLWAAIDEQGGLIEIDLERSDTRLLGAVPLSDVSHDLELHVSDRAEFCAVVERYGSKGAVLDLKTGSQTMQLDRGDYCVRVSLFPLAFAISGGKTILVHGTDWNRLDLSDPQSGKRLTERTSTHNQRGEPRPEHYLDYFHCGLAVSPSGEWIADNGWHWHPVGSIHTWNISDWQEKNVWESEDGPSVRDLCWRDYLWDAPICWIDDTTLAVWGEGGWDEDGGTDVVPAIRLFDVVPGTEIRSFRGPEVSPASTREPWARGWIVFDEMLYAISPEHGLAGWEIQSGEPVFTDPWVKPHRYHPETRQFLTLDQDGKGVIVSEGT